MELLDQEIIALVHLSRDALQAARLVDMDDAGHLVHHFGTEAKCSLHVRRFLVRLEVFRAVLVQDGRSEGTKFLAKLDSAIDLVLDIRPARIGEDGTIAQRPRAELGSSLDPADDPAFGQRLGGDPMNLSRPVTNLLRRIKTNKDIESLTRQGRTQVRSMRGGARFPVEVIVPVSEEGGTDSVAIVGGRGEDVQVLERRALQDHAV